MIKRGEKLSKKETKPKKKCSKCQKDKFVDRDYYMSNSPRHADKRIGVCKQCVLNELKVNEETDLLSEEYIKKVQDILLEMNRPYIHSEWTSSVGEGKERSVDLTRVFGFYLKNINLNHRDKDWRDSEFANEVEEEDYKKINSANKSKKNEENGLHLELNTQNEKDVLRLLGYDPFEYESEGDRSNLFNKLVDYLDESTLEDGFKLSSVIEIVRTFNQIDKINAAISKNMSDMKNFSKNAGSITALINAKDKMYKSVLDIAKENGISVKHATNKSKGAGTLSGIMKQLQEYDIHEASVNLFDINTAEGIRQVADLSNKSIMQQLQFDENDYSTMLQEQRELLLDSIEKAERLEEENRLLKIELTERDENIKELEEKIKETEE